MAVNQDWPKSSWTFFCKPHFYFTLIKFLSLCNFFTQKHIFKSTIFGMSGVYCPYFTQILKTSWILWLRNLKRVLVLKGKVSIKKCFHIKEIQINFRIPRRRELLTTGCTHLISIPSIYDSSPRLKRFMEGTFARIQNEFAPNQILLKTQ